LSFWLFFSDYVINADALTLNEALDLLKSQNLEIKVAKLDEKVAQEKKQTVTGMNWGKLTFTQDVARSDDAGNAFGFKLTSREADFGDFGADEFMNNFVACLQGDMSACSNMYTKPPSNLNHPDARNHFQTKFSYMVPLYTGGKLTQYKNITNALHKMSRLDTTKLLNEKIFQTTKTFYDISLVDRYIENLGSIINNIDKLAEIVANMREEGFAKEIDEMEVRARKSEVDSMLSQAGFNKELAYQYLSFLLNHEVSSIEHIDEMAPMPTVVKEEVQQDNLDIRKAKLGLKITDMAIKLQESNLLPVVGAFGEYGSADNHAFNDFTEKDSYTVGIQVSMNIFNGGIDDANLEKAKVKNLQVKSQVELAKRGIALKVKQLKTEALSLEADIKSYETQLRFASRVYESYRERYREGVVSISDVLIKQSKQLEVLLKLQTVKNKRNSKVFELNSILNSGE